MKKLILCFFCFIFIINMSFAKNIDPQSLGLDSYIVSDYESGSIITASNSKEEISVGTLTQLMTYLVVMDEMALTKGKGLTDNITVSLFKPIDSKNIDYLKDGSSHSIDDLIKKMFVFSLYDSANALASHFEITQDRFIKKMNRKAKQLGMNNTTYYNASGFSEGDLTNKSTAQDQMILIRHLLRKYPIILDYLNIDSIVKSNGEMLKSPVKEFQSKFDDFQVLKIDVDDSLKSAAGSFLLQDEKDSKRIIVLCFGAYTTEALEMSIQYLINNTKENYNPSQIDLIKNIDMSIKTYHSTKEAIENKASVEYNKYRSYLFFKQ